MGLCVQALSFTRYEAFVMAEPRPFRPKLFLYRTLLMIFIAEFLFLAFAFVQCSKPIPGKDAPVLTERCPKLGERSETLFIAAITTTLSLLTGVDRSEMK